MALIAVGYCRVSTENDDQINSFSAQKQFFETYICSQSDLTFYGIYADKGLSGTTTKNRTEFNRMINDARDGKFQMILTKEVSRFSRNILDTIAYTRELKKLGVTVVFLNDGISTADSDSELRLTIMASIAQEESRRTSQRVVWGQIRQMERGVVFGRSMLGYDIKNGALAVNEGGAEIVRLIFYQYVIQQKGPTQIADSLNKQGVKTVTGTAKWYSSTIIKILKNEKYVGDLVQRKSYTPDYLTHKKKRNNGNVPYVILRNHHPGIIDRQTWDAAQLKMERNNKHRCNRSSGAGTYALSGKILCGVCGAGFVCRTRKLKDGRQVRRWQCGNAVKNGKSRCSIGMQLRDDAVCDMIFKTLEYLKINYKDMLESVLLRIDQCRKDLESIQNSKSVSISQKILSMDVKLDDVLEHYVFGKISEDEYTRIRNRLEHKKEVLYEELEKAQTKSTESYDFAAVEQLLSESLSGNIGQELFIRSLVQKIVAFNDRRVEVYLRNISEPFEFLEVRQSSNSD